MVIVKIVMIRKSGRRMQTKRDSFLGEHNVDLYLPVLLCDVLQNTYENIDIKFACNVYYHRLVLRYKSLSGFFMIRFIVPIANRLGWMDVANDEMRFFFFHINRPAF